MTGREIEKKLQEGNRRGRIDHQDRTRSTFAKATADASAIPADVAIGYYGGVANFSGGGRHQERKMPGTGVWIVLLEIRAAETPIV